MAISLDYKPFTFNEKEQVAQLSSEVQVMKDQMSKVAVILEQLSQAINALREQAAKPTTQMAELKPLLDAMKVHVDSFPNAMREARRSDTATQKAIADFSSRLQQIEMRVLGSALQDGPTQ